MTMHRQSNLCPNTSDESMHTHAYPRGGQDKGVKLIGAISLSNAVHDVHEFWGRVHASWALEVDVECLGRVGCGVWGVGCGVRGTPLESTTSTP